MPNLTDALAASADLEALIAELQTLVQEASEAVEGEPPTASSPPLLGS